VPGRRPPTAYPVGVSRRLTVLALAADVVGLLVFAAIGRAGHDEAVSALGVLGTAAPFAIGLAAAWATPWVRARPASLPAGAVVLAGTAVIGLAVRAAVTGRLPLTFVIVSVCALGVLLVGWRAVALLVARLTVRRAGRPVG